jgi:tetratricopeptide (TPR) repeat protein
LSGDALAELANSIIGPEQLERGLLDALLLQTEGNVFFAVEIIRELAENAGSLSAIRHAPDGPVMTGGMKQLLQNRIERAPIWVRPLLDHVAVAGRMLDMPVIRVLSKSGVTLDTWLTVCADAALLDVSPEGAWRFAHDKIREAILADLPHEARSGLHSAVAQAIEQAHPDNPVYAGTIARHWSDAGDVRNASEAALRAEVYMRRTSAHKDAQNMLCYVLSRFSDDEYARYCVPLYLALGEHHVELGEFEQARESYKHGLALAERKNIRHGLARGPLGLAYIEWRVGNMHKALDLFGQVLEIEDTDTLSRIRALNFMGVYHSNNGAPDVAQRSLGEAEVLSIKSENREGLLLTKLNQGNLLHQFDNLEAALEATRMACTLAQQVGNGLAEAGALNNVALFLIYLSRLDEAERVLWEMETLVKRLGDYFLAVYAVRTRAILHQYRKEHAAAEVQYLNAIEAFESLGAISEVADSRYDLISNACASGNAANCEMHVRKLIEEARLVGISELKQLAIYAATLVMALTDQARLAKRWYAALPSQMRPATTRNLQIASIIENAIKSETSPPTAPELTSSDMLFVEIEAVFHQSLPL